jgi:hypothetical protein
MICGHQGGGLIAMQEHAMEEHGYTQEDHRRNTARNPKTNVWIYSFPDGVDWLYAERE